MAPARLARFVSYQLRCRAVRLSDDAQRGLVRFSAFVMIVSALGFTMNIVQIYRRVTWCFDGPHGARGRGITQNDTGTKFCQLDSGRPGERLIELPPEWTLVVFVAFGALAFAYILLDARFGRRPPIRRGHDVSTDVASP